MQFSGRSDGSFTVGGSGSVFWRQAVAVADRFSLCCLVGGNDVCMWFSFWWRCLWVARVVAVDAAHLQQLLSGLAFVGTAIQEPKGVCLCMVRGKRQLPAPPSATWTAPRTKEPGNNPDPLPPCPPPLPSPSAATTRPMCPIRTTRNAR